MLILKDMLDYNYMWPVDNKFSSLWNKSVKINHNINATNMINKLNTEFYLNRSFSIKSWYPFD